MNIIWSDEYLKYDFGPGHPFVTARALPFLDEAKKHPQDFQILEPNPAKKADVLLVHSPDYLERLEELARKKESLSKDTPVNPGVLHASYYYLGGTLLAFEKVLAGESSFNTLGGLHHAGISNSSGFCIFNDHAIAIKKYQKLGKIKKAMVVDLDVHAGQGTQEIFWQDPTVFTISLHQDPHTLYPGTGFANQKGEGAGYGYNLNFPLPPGTTGQEYLKTLDQSLKKISPFKPDILVVVLGVDTYKNDPLASINLEIADYKKIGQRFQDKKLVILAAGGYSLDVHLLWWSFLEGYLGKKFITPSCSSPY